MFYNEVEATKYHESTRIIHIQEEITKRAIELLNIPEGEVHNILDIGCGSGLSGEVIEDAGHLFTGMDISPSMLQLAASGENDGDVLLSDMGQGLPFRAATFDGCISISAVQWLCYSNKRGENPRRRLNQFFSSLYMSLKQGARCVLQLYPESPEQMEMISTSAMRAGFSGGLVVDFPNSSKAKKHYLCLFAGLPKQRADGSAPEVNMPQAIGQSGAGGGITNEQRNAQGGGKKRGKNRAPVKSRDWIVSKKERQRRQGKEVKKDTKFTGRSRPERF